jgi:hypothetical protein
VRWQLADGAVLQLLAWLGADAVAGLSVTRVGSPLFSTAPGVVSAGAIRELPPWFVGFSLASRPGPP